MLHAMATLRSKREDKVGAGSSLGHRNPPKARATFSFKAAARSHRRRQRWSEKEVHAVALCRFERASGSFNQRASHAVALCWGWRGRGGECGGMPAQSWCGVSRLWGVAPHAHDATPAHAVLLCAEPPSILGNAHFGATPIDSARLRAVRPSSSSPVVVRVRPLPSMSIGMRARVGARALLLISSLRSSWKKTRKQMAMQEQCARASRCTVLVLVKI